jgi:hypothetical protein
MALGSHRAPTLQTYGFYRNTRLIEAQLYSPAPRSSDQPPDSSLALPLPRAIRQGPGSLLQRLSYFAPSLLSLLILQACVASTRIGGSMTLAIVNGVVWTGDPGRPWAEAVGLTGDHIESVGSSAEIRRSISSATRVIDAHGRMVVPGFIDSHVHFLSGGMNLASVQLRDARSPTEFIARIKAFASSVPAATWITGGDWDHQNWG